MAVPVTVVARSWIFPCPLPSTSFPLFALPRSLSVPHSPYARSDDGRHALLSHTDTRGTHTRPSARARMCGIHIYLSLRARLYLAPVPRPLSVSTGRCQFLVDDRLVHNVRSRYGSPVPSVTSRYVAQRSVASHRHRIASRRAASPCVACVVSHVFRIDTRRVSRDLLAHSFPRARTVDACT